MFQIKIYAGTKAKLTRKWEIIPVEFEEILVENQDRPCTRLLDDVSYEHFWIQSGCWKLLSIINEIGDLGGFYVLQGQKLKV